MSHKSYHIEKYAFAVATMPLPRHIIIRMLMSYACRRCRLLRYIADAADVRAMLRCS